jgi:hypothetical protein
LSGESKINRSPHRGIALLKGLGVVLAFEGYWQLFFYENEKVLLEKRNRKEYCKDNQRYRMIC